MAQPAPVIRFEVAARKSWSWPHFLKMVRQLKKKRYKVTDKGTKTETHVVEVYDMESAVKVWQSVRSWVAVVCYLDGAFLPAMRLNAAMHGYVNRDLKQKWMLDGIIKKAQDKRDRGDDDARWRMGLGPRPEGN